MTHARRTTPLFVALFAFLACDGEPAPSVEARRADWVPDGSTSAATDGGTTEDVATDTTETDVEQEVAPNCPPGKELEDVSCNYKLTGSSVATPCRATLAAVLPDGRIEVTAEDSRDCICEFNSPGLIDAEAADCSELDPSYEDPNVGSELCLAMRYRYKPIFATKTTGTGATYDEAEAAALAACEAEAGTECLMICSRLANKGTVPPKRSITCCVPSEAPTDGPTDESCDPDAPCDPPSDVPSDPNVPSEPDLPAD